MWCASQQTQNICITLIQRRPNVFDVGPTLYKCYTNVLCLLGWVCFSPVACYYVIILCLIMSDMITWMTHLLYTGMDGMMTPPWDLYLKLSPPINSRALRYRTSLESCKTLEPGNCASNSNFKRAKTIRKQYNSAGQGQLYHIDNIFFANKCTYKRRLSSKRTLFLMNLVNIILW